MAESFSICYLVLYDRKNIVRAHVCVRLDFYIFVLICNIEIEIEQYIP